MKEPQLIIWTMQLYSLTSHYMTYKQKNYQRFLSLCQPFVCFVSLENNTFWANLLFCQCCEFLDLPFCCDMLSKVFESLLWPVWDWAPLIIIKIGSIGFGICLNSQPYLLLIFNLCHEFWKLMLLQLQHASQSWKSTLVPPTAESRNHINSDLLDLLFSPPAMVAAVVNF